MQNFNISIVLVTKHQMLLLLKRSILILKIKFDKENPNVISCHIYIFKQFQKGNLMDITFSFECLVSSSMGRLKGWKVLQNYPVGFSKLSSSLAIECSKKGDFYHFGV